MIPDDVDRPTPALVEALERHIDVRAGEIAELRSRVAAVEQEVNWLRTQVRVQQRAQPEGSTDAPYREPT